LLIKPPLRPHRLAINDLLVIGPVVVKTARV
jgi:hypothetical protein